MPKIIENLPEAILDAANGILSEQGFADFSIRAVAKKLGIAPATIYNYYPSKESILEALVREAWHRLMQSIDRETEGITDAFAALNKMYGLLQSAMTPMLSHWLAPGDRALPEGHPNGQEIFARKQELCGELTERIEGVLRRCGGNTADAAVFARLFIMCSHHRQLSFADIVSAIRNL